ncbi:Lrp/AsnC family transcriptional regulator [Streptomyces sp. NP160]|nr:Lrp/AsnC family transcriptional regulator [Streptomyces sp. NP160]
MDDIDLRLLTELRANARASHARLEELVRLSRNAVRQRIDRLERTGHISGYTITEGSGTAGAAASAVSATLLIDRVDRMRGAEVLAVLRSIPEVVRCEVVAGELDLLVRVEAAHPSRVQEIWTQLAALAGVRDITTAMTLSRVIDKTAGA